MVKIQYVGTMGTGFVQGVGVVQRGQTYDINESVAKNLLKTNSWKKVKESKPVLKVQDGSRFKKIKKSDKIIEEDE